MASDATRSSSADSTSKQESPETPEKLDHAPITVPGGTPRQATQSPLDGNSQTAEGSIKVKWTFSNVPEGDSVSSAILE